MVNSASGALWTLTGQQIRRFLASPARLTAFNRTMAARLAASLLAVLFA